ncbi:putative ankyrin repeat protein [Trichoderma barbatum]
MGLPSQASDEDIDAVLIGRDDVSDYNPEQLLPEPPEVIEEIRSWLQPTAYDIAGGEYRRHLSSHVAGTGHWLTSSDQYQEWQKSDEHGLLWIKGIPGSGKSVMAAKLIDEIAKSNPGTPVLYFFFRQIIDANHEPRALLRDWMDQILSYSPPLQKQLKAYVNAHRSLESISVETMWNSLRLAFASLPGKVFCVADALDEIDRGHEEFLRTLGGLGQWRPKTVKVLITSRPVASVEVPLRKTPCLNLRLQEALVDIDISTYVHYALSRSSIPESDWKVIASAVPGRANGLFLYAKLAMNAFLEPDIDINEVLLKLPTDLNALYTDLLNEHAKRSGVPDSIQHLILQSVTHATRPLRLLELAEMIRISFSGDSTRDIKATKELIRVACGPLLEILPDETVSVIHHSFTEYLKGTTRPDEDQHIGYPVLQNGPAHAQLAIQCILYLAAGCLSSVVLDTDEEIEDTPHTQWDSRSGRLELYRKVQDVEVHIRLQYPFFAYAASNWYQHIVKSEAAGHDQTEIIVKLNELFGSSDNMKAWLHMRWQDNILGARLVTKLHIAAKTGLVSYVKDLLGSFDINVPDIYDRTPLWWAAFEGHADVISALIESGADPDQPDNLTGVKPLHIAASSNHTAAVTALLKAGVNPLTEKTLEDPWLRCGNIPSSVGEAPLMYACCGHLEALEAFLPFIKEDAALINRALVWAASSGSSNCVAMLLQQPGVDINATVDGQTPLYRACEEVNDAIVSLLLQAGADPNIKCDVGREVSYRWAYLQEEPALLNCFFALCNRDRSGRFNDSLQIIFPLLVQAGVDIHYRTPLGETALHTAAQCPVLVKLLLEAGIDANVKDISGGTPLHFIRSAMEPVMPSIELLVEQGHADINAANEDGQTPLHAFIPTLPQATLMRFLEYGPNCNTADSRGNTPLHILMMQHSTDMELVKALLIRGADPNARNHDGVTPLLLWSQASDGHVGILDSLLESGADINVVDRDGNNLLFRILHGYNYLHGEEVHNDIKILIDRGLSPSQRNFHGETALHYLLGWRNSHVNAHTMSRLNFLISLNLDVKAVDHRGNTLFHTLAMQRDNHDSFDSILLMALWEKLLALGLNLEQKNHAGRTPLHILCASHTHSIRVMPGNVMCIDFVISRVKNLNVPDMDGITPLHLAVTCGRLYAKKLIDACANPLVYTHEGLTPLHLAARCRDSNNVGLLLDALKKEQQDRIATVNNNAQPEIPDSLPMDKEMTKRRSVLGVNAKVLHGTTHITPLYYACKSGRPETVSLLLEAGADVKIGNVFQACLEFEEECDLWKQPQTPQHYDEHQYKSPLRITDTYRYGGYDLWTSGVRGISSDDTARLEEIIDMLVEYGADISQLERNTAKQQEGIINTAFTTNRDYTAACLGRAVALSSKTEDGLDELTKFSGATYRHEKEATIQALASSNFIHPGDEDQVVALSLVTRFVIRRDYHLLEELVRLGATFLPKPTPYARYNLSENCSLSHLIQLGFTSIVEKIAAIETQAKLEEGEWHAVGDKTKPGLYFSKKDGSTNYVNPFILDAVQRELPNMDAVRLLVEKFAIDINDTDIAMESALFHVARGNNWWQVHQALPYLLDAGANIHMRNAKGQTPLHMALQADDNWPGPFNWDAAKTLIERGADVNAVDEKGKSCLAYAQHNVDMINFLIKHGATVAVDSIFGAIEASNIKVLQALLSGGIDPNTRRDKPVEDLEEKKTKKDEIAPNEEFPLYYAAKRLSPRWCQSDGFDKELAGKMEIVRVLIDHGANPFAKFLKKHTGPENEFDLSEAQTTTIEVPKGYKECTLLHEVLRLDIIVDPFVLLPTLDVKHRDAKGRTLLHMICENRGALDGGGPDHIIGIFGKNPKIAREEGVTAFQQLLSLGAELEATDNFGRNVVHYMLAGKVHTYFNAYKKSLAFIIDKAPHLLNQADGNGNTPFHYAIRRAIKQDTVEEAKMLLEGGADHTVVNKKGETLLHILGQRISMADLRNFFQTLVGRGIDINARNNRGETALFSFYSCHKDGSSWLYYDDADKPSPELAKPILETLGGDFFARDNKGRGLLHAAAAGEVERFQELMDMGLDPMMEDNAQQTAIDAAAACGNLDILELFEKKV